LVRPSEQRENNPVPHIFLCHASEDKVAVGELYARLRKDGFRPWLDEEDILPGQDWNDAIRTALKDSAAVLVYLSPCAVTKKGYVQREIKLVLDVADEKPEGTIFVIPVHLERCNLPDRLSRWQNTNLFDPRGYERLKKALQARLQPEVQVRVPASGIGLWPVNGMGMNVVRGVEDNDQPNGKFACYAVFNIAAVPDEIDLLAFEGIYFANGCPCLQRRPGLEIGGAHSKSSAITVRSRSHAGSPPQNCSVTNASFNRRLCRRPQRIATTAICNSTLPIGQLNKPNY
jgi:hypothetical protein